MDEESVAMSQEGKRTIVISWGIALIMLFLAWAIAGKVAMSIIGVIGLALVLHGHRPTVFTLRRILLVLSTIAVIAAIFGGGYWYAKKGVMISGQPKIADGPRQAEVPVSTPAPKESKDTEPHKDGGSAKNASTSHNPGKTASAGSATVGTVSAGACSAVQVGGVGNTANGGTCGPVDRHLNEAEIASLKKMAVGLPESAPGWLSVETVNSEDSPGYAGEIYKILSELHRVHAGPTFRLYDPSPEFKGLYVLFSNEEDEHFGWAEKLAKTLPPGTILTHADGLQPGEVKIVVQRATQPAEQQKK